MALDGLRVIRTLPGVMRKIQALFWYQNLRKFEKNLKWLGRAPLISHGEKIENWGYSCFTYNTFRSSPSHVRSIEKINLRISDASWCNMLTVLRDKCKSISSLMLFGNYLNTPHFCSITEDAIICDGLGSLSSPYLILWIYHIILLGCILLCELIRR